MWGAVAGWDTSGRRVAFLAITSAVGWAMLALLLVTALWWLRQRSQDPR